MFGSLLSRLKGGSPPTDARAWAVAGLEAYDRGALGEAQAAFERALALEPDSPDILVNLSGVHLLAARPAAAAEALERALRLAPDHAAAHCNYGMLLAQNGNCDAAAAHLQRVPRDNASIRAADINLTHALMQGCDWNALEAHVAARLATRADDPGWWRSFEPSQAAPLGLDPEVARSLADAHAAALCAGIAPLPLPPRPAGARLRIGYHSADFHHHATMGLLLDTLEAHDRDRVEVVMYSYGPDDGSTDRRRAIAAADRFVEVRAMSHADIARTIAAHGIDVLVDLKGHTGDGRPQVNAFRPAGTIVNYLGYPGTMGGRLADWYLGDAVSTPEGCEAHFSERLLRLPRTYQSNNAWRTLEPPPSRAALGLPVQGPLLCCFNALYKISRATFTAWMAILHAVPGSTLWLLAGNADAMARLRQAAMAAGIAAQRLVFAPHAPSALHLARLAAADLFLDTWPCGAHTLASDALRAGVPIVTLPGAGFASRVAASLLAVAGVEELAAPDVDGYIRLAVQLALDGPRRAALRGRIAAGRSSLFDPAGHARALEDAYGAAHEAARRG